MMNTKGLGGRLSEIRKKRKLTQQKLAETLKVSRSAIALWECGASRPSIDNIGNLSHILDISPMYLIFGEKENMNTFVSIHEKDYRTANKINNYITIPVLGEKEHLFYIREKNTNNMLVCCDKEKEVCFFPEKFYILYKKQHKVVTLFKEGEDILFLHNKEQKTNIDKKNCKIVAKIILELNFTYY